MHSMAPLRNVHCAQVILQIKFNYVFISAGLERSNVSKYVNRFELYLIWNKCILHTVYYFLTRDVFFHLSGNYKKKCVS